MGSEFEKNVFLPNEIVKGYVHVDNTHCTIACTRVEFAVERRFKMTIHGASIFGEGPAHSYTDTDHLVEQNLTGPGPGVGDWKKEMICDLNKIHYEVQGDRKNKKTGARKPLTKEDRFMMSSIQPACHGKWINNEYHLIVKC